MLRLGLAFTGQFEVFNTALQGLLIAVHNACTFTAVADADVVLSNTVDVIEEALALGQAAVLFVFPDDGYDTASLPQAHDRFLVVVHARNDYFHPLRTFLDTIHAAADRQASE